MKRLFIALTIPLFAGCGTNAVIGDGQFAVSHPVSIACKGKGTITGTGYGGASVMVSGSGNNAFTIQADCGDGFEFIQSAK